MLAYKNKLKIRLTTFVEKFGHVEPTVSQLGSVIVVNGLSQLESNLSLSLSKI